MITVRGKERLWWRTWRTTATCANVSWMPRWHEATLLECLARDIDI